MGKQKIECLSTYQAGDTYRFSGWLCKARQYLVGSTTRLEYGLSHEDVVCAIEGPIKDELSKVSSERDALQAEVERLRDAMEEAADILSGGTVTALEQAVPVLRAALQPQGAE